MKIYVFAAQHSSNPFLADAYLPREALWQVGQGNGFALIGVPGFFCASEDETNWNQRKILE